MIESLLTWFYSYVSYYALDIVLFLLIGYVFIRCRSIGYAFSAVLVLVLIFFTYVGGYAMPQGDTVIVILLGTLAGGWRYVAHARHGQLSFGFPFFGRSASSKPTILERYEAFLARRRYQKTYAEELARENAKHDSTARNDSQSGSTNQEPSKSQSRRQEATEEQRRRHEKRKERSNSTAESASSDTNSRTPEEILGLTVGFTREDLKRQYRKLSDKYHPDKNQHMSEVVRKEMEEELIRVNLAYKLLKTRV